MSISQFMIAGGWLLSFDFKNKANILRKTPVALLMIGLFLIHLLGLIYSSDLEYAFKDLRIKLPILILPLLLATGPRLGHSDFRNILIAIVSGTVISTAISFFVYNGWIIREVNDIRDISIFISHIRLVLMCCVTIFICCWYLFFSSNLHFGIKVLLCLISIWMLYFVLLMQSITGVLVLDVTFSLLSVYFLIYAKKKTVKYFPIILVCLLIFFAVSKYNKVSELFVVVEDIESVNLNLRTTQGNEYVTYSDRKEYENGYPVWAYVCEKELEQQWSKRSEYPYMGFDDRNQEIRFTLIRYLTSLGLRKDADAISKLNASDLKAIERGIANNIYVTGDKIDTRLHQILWEIHNYKAGHDPSGHSVAQRFEFWKASVGIIKKHPIFGVGTGDVPNAFTIQYDEMQSVLKQDWRLRSHNQYLSITIAFGVIGLGYFLILCVYPIFKSMQRSDFLYITFAIAALISMLTEDTLETQAGVTFYTFFSCLFLFVNPQNRAIDGNT